MVVKELMTTNVFFLKEQETVLDAIRLMRRCNIGFVPVCNHFGELIGIVTDRDLMVHADCAGKDYFHQAVTNVMTKEVEILSPDTEIHQAALQFSEKKLHRFPVVQGNQLIGVLSISDLAKRRIYLAEVGDIIGAITMDKYTKK